MTLPIANTSGGYSSISRYSVNVSNYHSPQEGILAVILDQSLTASHSQFPHPGPLQNFLRHGEGGNLIQAVANLTAAQKDQLRSQLGAQGVSEILSLAEESDPDIFYSDLLTWARNRQREDRLGLAGAVYHLLSQEPDSTLSPSRIPAGVRQRAQQEMEILLGGGGLGAQLEFQSQRFFQGATAPAMIVGMAVGSTVFTGVRSLVLPRIWASGSANFLARGVGARLAASTIAWVPEVGSFWLTTKSIEEWIHPGSQRWDAQSNWRELASLGITLGLLRSTGFLFGRGHQWAAGIHETRGAGSLIQALAGGSLPLWEQTGMFTGISLAQGTEMLLGWRPVQPTTAFFAGSLITLTQFNIGGRLSQTLFPRLYSWNERLNQRLFFEEQSQLKLWERTPRDPPVSEGGTWADSFGFFRPALQTAGLGPRFPGTFQGPKASWENLVQSPLAMSGRAGRQGGHTPPSGEPMISNNESMIRQLWTAPYPMMAEILEKAPLGILITNPQGIIFQANRQARLLLIDDADMIVGRSLRELLVPDSDGTETIQPQILRDEATPLQLREMSLNLGKFKAHYLLDQTRESELEATNRRMANTLEELAVIEDHHNIAAAIIHDLANSLFPLHVFLDKDLPKLSRLWNKNHPPEEHLTVDINGIAEYLNAAIERIRSFQSLGRRGKKGQIEPLVLMDLVSQSINLQSPRMKGRTVHISRDSTGPQPVVQGDRVALVNTLMNLIYNAHQATPADGTISVHIKWVPHEVMLEVVDTGQGIRPENMDQIFNPFFTTKPEGVGNGLGLFISKKVVEETHSGRLDVESELGVGTTFRITLPTTPAGIYPSRETK